MAEKEQVRPLAPAFHRINVVVVDEDDAISMELKSHHRHRKYIKCCGCITALMLIQAVIILVLVFTVFRVKNPVMKINSMKMEGLDVVNMTNLPSGTNLTVLADVSVKNPNVASFKFNNVTTSLYYDGKVVGEARTPPGHASAGRTIRMNVTVDVMLGRILAVPRLSGDLVSGLLPVSSYTSIGGRVKILKIIKRNVVVEMNCTMTVNIRSQEVQDQSCKQKISH
ncbi:unnamed protein product [Ilex paraguariensis]|uniref:Late embryogenesis abundant protein LEA-2 subgroup domain-containing protein n=1 Tax=Ilex paraguariensis TaxID=185542 RepID=A0ABC8TT49_9AQUA